MNSRTKRIQNAFEVVDKRDGRCCLVCYLPFADRAHIFPRNTRYGNPDDPNGIVSLCRNHHTEYDKIKDHQLKYDWLMSHGLKTFADYLISHGKKNIRQ